MPPNSQQRRETILDQILQRGHVTVKNLAEEMSVSEATVRRDLRSLSDEGELELVYGGATLPRRSDFSLHTKAKLNVESKRLIGRLAASLVGDGETILLDSGTTVYEMTPCLKAKRGMTIILNSARHAMELGSSSDANIIHLGGQYRPDTMDTVGPMAVATLEQLRGFRAFIGADGLSMEFGVTACDIESAHLYRLAIRNAREAILLVDHTKFLAPSLFKFCEVDAVSRVVTDREPLPEWMEYLHEKGIEVLYPEKVKDEVAP